MDSARSYGHSYELLVSPAAITSSIGELGCDPEDGASLRAYAKFRGHNELDT